MVKGLLSCPRYHLLLSAQPALTASKRLTLTLTETPRRPGLMPGLGPVPSAAVSRTQTWGQEAALGDKRGLY